MSSRLTLEKVLGGLVIATLVAIVWERQILETRMTILPSDGYRVAVYDDDVRGGNSVARLISRDEFRWHCSLRDQYAYPFCGFELLFDPSRQNGLDLSQYDRIRLWLDYSGNPATVRVYLRNFNPVYSVPGQNDTTKYNQIEFATNLLNKPVEFDLADFFVANWWFQQLRLSPQESHPEFDNIVILEVQTGSTAPLGEYEFTLRQIELSGQRLTTLQWYQLIMAVWLVVSMLFLGIRVLYLNRELRRKHERERELLEVNALLDRRGRELEELARTDPLTGAFNREGVKDAIKEGLVDWRREGKPLSIVMLDIDHFKHINDTYGHLAGDRILAGLTELVQANVRGSDLFARWGGEEFLLVCCDTPAPDATRLAEKLRLLVEQHHFSAHVKVTVSLGVATLERGESLDSIFARADAALYQAKKEGRNRVVSASGECATAPAPPAESA